MKTPKRSSAAALGAAFLLSTLQLPALSAQDSALRGATSYAPVASTRSFEDVILSLIPLCRCRRAL